MPPPCDTMDGPVVQAAKKALETGNVNLILPWIQKVSETELKNAFQKTIQVRKLGNGSMEFADRWFYETAVRLHREGKALHVLDSNLQDLMLALSYQEQKK